MTKLIFNSLSLLPSKRPHPCLLYSMYLLASRISASPSIRALETHFATIASRQLEESIAKADRLFDATRAACILATYKYSNARYHEGWMMVGLAARWVCASASLPRELMYDLGWRCRVACIRSLRRCSSQACCREIGRRIWYPSFVRGRSACRLRRILSSLGRGLGHCE